MALVKYNNNSISAVTSASSIPNGALTHIKTLTASSSSTLSFVDGSSDVVLDSTYPIYVFKFINIHADTDATQFTFNFSTDTGSNYNVTKTTTVFIAYHNEGDSGTGLPYVTDADIAQGTGFQNLSEQSFMSSDADHSLSGELRIYSPASTTFVKHFLSHTTYANKTDYSVNFFGAGYGNTTSAVNAVQFKSSSGTFDGTIKLYGIKDS
tara:strand:+ start:461 stop:1087 length:627 start_codon:yes stop_codon:yes gene_type:complete